MAGSHNVWVCAEDLQLIRADRIISLLAPLAAGHGAASLGGQAPPSGIYAEIDGGTQGDALTRIKLTSCSQQPPAELLTGLASALALATATDPGK